jgi:peptidase E
LTFADLARRGGKTFNRIQEMTTNGHPNPVAAPVAAAKLFTGGAAGASLRPAAPPMNNFG